MTTIDRLVSMVNQIVANLVHEPDPAAAAAEHIRLYWDPRMKKLISEYSGDGLSPTAAAAINQLVKPDDAA
jgi:formate dehydrogenase subunit delta